MAAAKLSRASPGWPEEGAGTGSDVVANGGGERGGGENDVRNGEQRSGTMRTMVVRNQRECNRKGRILVSAWPPSRCRRPRPHDVRSPEARLVSTITAANHINPSSARPRRTTAPRRSSSESGSPDAGQAPESSPNLASRRRQRLCGLFLPSASPPSHNSAIPWADAYLTLKPFKNDIKTL